MQTFAKLDNHRDQIESQKTSTPSYPIYSQCRLQLYFSSGIIEESLSLLIDINYFMINDI